MGTCGHQAVGRPRGVALCQVLLLLSACVHSQSHEQPPMQATMSQYEHGNNPYYSHTDTATLNVPLSEWRKLLPTELYHITFEKGT